MVKAKPRTGRPTKYSPQMHKAIIEYLEAGMSRTTAAELAGITRQTLTEWAGSPPDWQGSYPTFSYDVKQAIAKAKSRATVTIANAIKDGDVNAAFRYLSYQEPEEWSAPERHEVTGSGGTPLTVVINERSDGPV